MSGIDQLPEPVRKALMLALIRGGTKPPTDEDPADDSAGLVLEAIKMGESADDESGAGFMEFMRAIGRDDTRRPATIEEAQRLVKLAGPCRFKPGDLVQWNPELRTENYTFPKLGDVCVVTQVFDVPLHNTTDSSGNEMAVRNDMALAYVREEGDRLAMYEYTYDSRRFIAVKAPRSPRRAA